MAVEQIIQFVCAALSLIYCYFKRYRYIKYNIMITIIILQFAIFPSRNNR